MGNISNEERARRAQAAAAEASEPVVPAPSAEAYEPEGSELEEFEQPVPKVTAEQATPHGMAKIRVLPKGDGKVATGHYDRQTNTFTMHKKGDHLFVHPSVAKQQEDNGLVEIVEDTTA